MWPVSYMYALSAFVWLFIVCKAAICDSIGVQDKFPSKDNKGYLILYRDTHFELGIKLSPFWLLANRSTSRATAPPRVTPYVHVHANDLSRDSGYGGSFQLASIETLCSRVGHVLP